MVYASCNQIKPNSSCSSVACILRPVVRISSTWLQLLTTAGDLAVAWVCYEDTIICCLVLLQICGGDWAKHSTDTGGYFKCNITAPPPQESTSLGADSAQGRASSQPVPEAGQAAGAGAGLFGSLFGKFADAGARWKLDFFMRRFLAHDCSERQLQVKPHLATACISHGNIYCPVAHAVAAHTYRPPLCCTALTSVACKCGVQVADTSPYMSIKCHKFPALKTSHCHCYAVRLMVLLQALQITAKHSSTTNMQMAECQMPC